VNGREISVGFSVSLSGRLQLQGQQALRGILLWNSYANAQGGISIGTGEKRSVRLIWHDDRSQAGRARDNVLRLVHEDHVDILLGPYSSSLTLAVGEIAEQHKKVLWNYGGSSDEIFTRGWRYLVGIASPASDYLRALSRWTSKEYSLRRICVLYSDKGSFGWQVARGVLESAQEVVQSVELIPMDSPLKNCDAIRSALFEIGPEVVVLAGSFQDELMIMRGRPNWPATVRALAAVAAGIHAFSAQLGGLEDGVVGPSQWEPGVSLPDIRGPTSDWFADSFEKQFGSPPDYIAAGSFATGVIVTECIRRAASLDDDRLRSIASDLDCNTFYGRFRIDAQSGKQVGHRILLIRWREGRKVVLPS
jgi:branched-chain amino acid transport system substrate-binding protein